MVCDGAQISIDFNFEGRQTFNDRYGAIFMESESDNPGDPRENPQFISSLIPDGDPHSGQGL